MFYPYVTLGDQTKVVHTPWDGNQTTVHFEKPDNKNCPKTLDCIVPGYEVHSVVGFTGDDILRLITFCRNNTELLIEYSKCGGIANA